MTMSQIGTCRRKGAPQHGFHVSGGGGAFEDSQGAQSWRCAGL